MLNLISWVLIPGLTLLMTGTESWTESNFSVVGSRPPWNFLLLIWGTAAGGYFYFLINHTAARLSPAGQKRRELLLAQTAVLLLAVSVLLPYAPESRPVLAAVHVVCAFSASALLYLTFLSMAFRMYFYSPDQFRSYLALLLSALPVCGFLFFAAGGLISSALEVFFTIFCSLWGTRFYQTVLRFGPRPSPSS